MPRELDSRRHVTVDLSVEMERVCLLSRAEISLQKQNGSL
jgi:hypothetical protein